MVGRPPVGSGARAGCCRAAPSERRRLPRARHRIVPRLISSRGPAANLRPISRSAANAFSLGPGEPARELVHLPDPPAVGQTRQAQVPPPVWRHSPHPSLCPVLSGSSTSAVSRLQAANPDCVPRPSPSRASHATLGAESAASIVTSCAAHPRCPRHGSSSDSVFGSSAFPRRRRPSVPRLSVPLAHGPSVSHSAAVSFAPSESVPRGSQAVRPLDPQEAHGPSVPQAVSFAPSESVPRGSQAVISYPVLG